MKFTIAIFLQRPGLISLTMSDAQAQHLAELLPDCRIIQCHDEAEFIAALPQSDIVLTWTFRQEWFDLAPKLRLVSTPAAGKDYFTVEWPNGIAHWNGSFHGRIMAESAVGMLLGMCRGILSACTTYRNDAWPRTQIDAMSTTLFGSTVTICGFGNIGRTIGKCLKPFGVRIIGVCAHAGHDAPEYFTEDDCIITTDCVDSVLPSTDHLILVMPRTAQTDGFLSRERLKLLPAHATVSNLGRGNAIDEAALCDALNNGALAGACLDVTALEPLPANSPLRQCRNLWITPHSSAFSHRYMDYFAEEFAQRLKSDASMRIQ